MGFIDKLLGKEPTVTEEADLLRIISEYAPVKKGVAELRAQRDTAWRGQKAALRLRLRELDRAHGEAEPVMGRRMATALADMAAARQVAWAAELDRDAKRAKHSAEIQRAQAQLRALGAPALEECFAEAERRLAEAGAIRVGWQDAKALDTYRRALQDVRDAAQGAIAGAHDMEDEALVAKLWATVPAKPQPSESLPVPYGQSREDVLAQHRRGVTA